MNAYPNKINVLFVIMQMQMGGSERLVHNLVRMLDRNIFNPSVAWFFGDKILKEFYDLNVPLYHVPKVKRVDFSTMRKLGDIINENDIHVVNSHHYMSMVYSYYGCKIKNHTKLIYTEHSEWEVEQISWKWKTIGRYLLNRADAAVGVSAEVRQRIISTFKMDSSKTFSIQNGVNVAAFSRNEASGALKKELGIAEDDKVIGAVANLKKIKNHIFLLNAFNELIKVNKKAKLLLIGQGFDNESDNTVTEIRNFINNNRLNENVLLLGYRSDIAALLRIMDIFCLTSFKEGLPIALIEAMASGLPAVGTDVQGIRDVIVPNKNGLLVNLGDVGGLKNAMLALLADKSLRERLGKGSKTLAKDIYSLDHCVKKYQDLYMSLAKNDPIQ